MAAHINHSLHINSLLTLPQMTTALTENPSLTRLSFNYITLSEEDFTQLAEPLKALSTLRTLSIEGVSLDTDFKIQTLIQILRNNPELTSLTLESNAIREEASAQIFQAIENCPLSSITYWNQPSGKISGKAFARLVERDLFHLTHLNLGPITDGLCPFAESLASNSHLTKLELYNIEEGDEIGIRIAASLTHHQYLKYLLCTESNLTDVSGKAFSDAINNNTSLEVLDLKQNQFTDETGSHFACALQNNVSLQRLILTGNSFTEAVVTIFADAIKNSSIPYIFIDSYGGDNWQRLEKKLQINRENLNTMTTPLTHLLLRELYLPSPSPPPHFRSRRKKLHCAIS